MSMTVVFISIGRTPFLVSTLENADQLFALMITPDVYLHHVEMADQDPASGCLAADCHQFWF